MGLWRAPRGYDDEGDLWEASRSGDACREIEVPQAEGQLPSRAHVSPGQLHEEGTSASEAVGTDNRDV